MPEEKVLERLVRYETQAERGLQRSIEQLAKLRAATRELLSSRLLGRLPDGTLVAVEQQRTRRIEQGLARKKLPNEARATSLFD